MNEVSEEIRTDPVLLALSNQNNTYDGFKTEDLDGIIMCNNFVIALEYVGNNKLNHYQESMGSLQYLFHILH